MPLPDLPLFSSHNVVLPNGRLTAPGLPLVSDSYACRAALRALDQVFGDAREGVTVADLGSLEGGYAAAFARAGYDVTGFEARQENHDNAVWLQEALGLPNLRFVQGDARELLEGRQFDVVFCSGLLYHLDKPVAFLKLLGQVTRRMLVLNTNVSQPGTGHPETAHHPGSGCDYGAYENEGRQGHWYRESVTRWDSYGNSLSFWLRRDDLMDSLREDAGFATVTEIPDWRDGSLKDHVPGGAGPFADRRMFTALK
jgi:SAM-dependent methyltransferase